MATRATPRSESVLLGLQVTRSDPLFIRVDIVGNDFITKTSPCNNHPLTHHFYIVKLGFTGVYRDIHFFLFLL